MDIDKGIKGLILVLVAGLAVSLLSHYSTQKKYRQLCDQILEFYDSHPGQIPTNREWLAIENACYEDPYAGQPE